jgi:hypothetical protein
MTASLNSLSTLLSQPLLAAKIRSLRCGRYLGTTLNRRTPPSSSLRPDRSLISRAQLYAIHGLKAKGQPNSIAGRSDLGCSQPAPGSFHNRRSAFYDLDGSARDGRSGWFSAGPLSSGDAWKQTRPPLSLPTLRTNSPQKLKWPARMVLR